MASFEQRIILILQRLRLAPYLLLENAKTYPQQTDILIDVLEKAPYLFTTRRPTLPGLEVRFEATLNSAAKPIQKHRRSSSNSISRIHKRRLQTSSYTHFSQVRQPTFAIQDLSQQQPSDAVPRTIVEQDITTVAELEKIYRCQNIESILNDNNDHLHIQGSAEPFDVVVDIILAIERSDQIIEIKQLWKRIYCYVLAKLHLKRTSIDDIVQRAQYTMGNVKTIKTKVYHYFRLGNR
jgi:hypothetical protein